MISKIKILMMITVVINKIINNLIKIILVTAVIAIANQVIIIHPSNLKIMPSNK
jgi:hypothetical protein